MYTASSNNMSQRQRPVTSAPVIRGSCYAPVEITQTEYAHRTATPFSDGLSMLCGDSMPRERIFVPDKELDDETLRTRKYWRRWGRQAARDILKEAQREQAQEERRRNRPQLIVTARCATPPLSESDRELSSGSCESLNTRISLFNTAASQNHLAMAPSLDSPQTRRRRDAAAGNDGRPKPNWEKFNQKRRGLLFEMMSRDADQLQGVIRGNGPVHDELDEVMTPEERALVHSCAFRRGISGRTKSNSTANLLSIIPKPPTRSKTSKRKSRRARERTPSPSRIADDLQQDDRPESATASFAKNLHQRIAPSALSRSITQSSLRSSVKSMPRSVKSTTRLGMPDVEGVLSRRIKTKLSRTYSALERITGEGDPRNTITQTTDEKGRYTDADYARYPRYPQNIRICPQLSQVIREDTQRRMGRPRQHKLKERDVRLHEQDTNNSLGRSQRNLIIFNWLNNIDEGNYEVLKVPDIVDVEENGIDRAEKVYPQLYTEYTMTAEDYTRAGTSRGGGGGGGDCSSVEHYGSEGSEAFSVSVSSDEG